MAVTLERMLIGCIDHSGVNILPFREFDFDSC